MTMPNCWVKIIPGLWFSAALLWAAGGADLASLVRDYRAAPTALRRASVEAWARAHPKDSPLARLALGVTAYEHQDYPTAILFLRQVQSALPRIADYPAYYLAAARVEDHDFEGVPADLAPVRSGPPSPLADRSWLLEARALKASDAPEAVRILSEHYQALPQPDGDLALADCYQAAHDLSSAADIYQRVYARYVTGEAAARSAAALLTLKDAMGAAYPQPLPQQRLERAGRLLDARQFAAARAAYQSLSESSNALVRAQARVRLGVIEFQAGRVSLARAALEGWESPEPEADAERLYYLVECHRRLDQEQQMMEAIHRLNDRYPKSAWRQRALITAANYFLLDNRPDDYAPLCKADYTDFPTDPTAPLCHWKIAFAAYMRNQPDAAGLLREHVRNYPSHYTAGGALYFLGRQAENAGSFSEARRYYRQLLAAWENHYYSMLARLRLARPEIANAAAGTQAVDFPQPQPAPFPPEATAATTVRIERSRLLRSAGLDGLADAELRFGARTDGQRPLLALELATSAPAPHRAVQALKAMEPDYLELSLSQAPRKFWELLFPLPFRDELIADARSRGLDPYLVAGLVRQESEFDPGARSPAKAYGLTQVLPVTGRQYARTAGVRPFTTRALLQPAVNLKIGTTILRGMLDQQGGSWEQTLAAYNAGPNRVAQWITWNHYREPAEFVESIPFTETRDYVQAVLRNADIYRRLYR